MNKQRKIDKIYWGSRGENRQLKGIDMSFV